MLNFRTASIGFGLVLTVMVLLDLNGQITWYWYLVAILGYLTILAYGSVQVAASFYTPVISSGPAGKKQIAISFDDGPALNFTPGILDILESAAVPGAFFCIGKNVAGNESILRRIHEEGHIIGNHSHSHHFWFDLYSSGKMTTDLNQMNEEMIRVLGLQPRLFRPPYGVTNPNLAAAIKRLKLIAVGWNVRSMDTVVKDPKKLLLKMMPALEPGAIFLFHDTSEATFLMLPAFIEYVRAQGYEFVRLDKLLNIEAYA